MNDLKKFDRRLVLSVAFLAPFAGTAAQAQAADPAVALIERFYASLRAAMARAAGGVTVADKARLLTGPVNSTFDTAAMTRLAVGQYWSSIPGGQQGAIQQAFSRFLVASYAKQIRGFSGERFEVSPETEKRRVGTLVRSKVYDGSSPTSVDYLVAGGRVVDVYLNNSVSELASRRAEFESILSSGGASALLSSLTERTNRLLAS
ncbi:MAG: hopanoid biosynthesis protein HpnM [Methylobacterium sp.]|nr:MAG: hopanoid biosynthesis protein HpnM [Methylobacterium sp.]